MKRKGDVSNHKVRDVGWNQGRQKGNERKLKIGKIKPQTKDISSLHEILVTLLHTPTFTPHCRITLDRSGRDSHDCTAKLA